MTSPNEISIFKGINKKRSGTSLFSGGAIVGAASVFLILGRPITHADTRIQQALQQRLGDLINLDRQLQDQRYVEPHCDPLSAYLAKIRRDGTQNHSDMKNLLDQESSQISAIDALLAAYSPQAKTSNFATQVEKFHTYSIVWHDRWNNVFELFMAGGNLPSSDPGIPEGFEAMLRQEVTTQ